MSPILLPSRIDAVKVYATGATITRLADLSTIPANLPDQVEIAGLPLALNDATVRVRIEGGNGQRAIATDVQIGLYVPPPPIVETTSLEEEIRQATQDVKHLETLITLINNEIATLQQLTVPDRPSVDAGKAPPPSPISARLALTSFQDEQIRARYQEQRQNGEKLRLATEHLEDLRQQETQASTARQAKPHELRKTVIVRLEWSEVGSNSDTVQPANVPENHDPSPLQLLIDYFIPGAQWTPAYVCRLDSATNTATIAVRAFICQKTGEDWSGVKLALSTAKPLTWCELPELPSLRLGRAQTLPSKPGWRAAPVGAEQLFADFDHQQSGTIASLRQQYTRVNLPAIAVPQPPTLSPKTVSPIADYQQWIDSTITQSKVIMKDEFKGEAAFTEVEQEFTDQALFGAAGSVPPPEGQLGAIRSKRVAMPAAPSAMERSERPKRLQPSAPEPDAEERTAMETGQLVYGLMRLGGMEDTGKRGQLAIASTYNRYLEILTRHHISVQFDVISIVHQAISTAEECLAVPLPPGGVSVRTMTDSFDYAYQADGRIDVAADGQFHSVALTQQSTPVEVRYVVVPREDTNVFRIAQLKNPLRAPLLPGTTDVYVDGDYILSTVIPTVPPKGQMELGLGVEQAIKVARNTRFEEVRSGKILVAFNEFRHQIDLAIANNLPKSIQIEVRERLPVPREGAKVEVDVNTVSPPWEKYEQEERSVPIKGGYRWQIQIPPRDRTTLTVQYTVKTYADSEVIGGNHRERS